MPWPSPGPQRADGLAFSFVHALGTGWSLAPTLRRVGTCEFGTGSSQLQRRGLIRGKTTARVKMHVHQPLERSKIYFFSNVILGATHGNASRCMSLHALTLVE